jgi:two-component system response regulator AtoC
VGAAIYLVTPASPLGLGLSAPTASNITAVDHTLLVSVLRVRRQTLRDDEDRSVCGNSEKMRNIATVIEQVADSDVTVLIRGDSGVGKELVSRAIHQRSTRKHRPFVKVNCAALPAELLESELFGHERGAFTGAATTRIGKFEQADTGTLFMDEIGELKPALQAKLLHVLQDVQFTKLGSNRPVTVDVRVVAATNRDLESMLAGGEFREDRYYRLKVIEVTVPPLRERRGELTHLSGYFIDRYARRYNRPARQLSATLQELFHTYDWPGNIRELENMIKRIVILQDEELVIREMSRSPRAVATYAAAGVAAVREDALISSNGSGDIDAAPIDDEEPESPPEVVVATAPAGSRLADIAKAAAMQAERLIIDDTLRQVNWNRRRAAEQLGVSYKTLLNKIKECGINRK